MARITLEGMQELIDKVNKLGTQGESIKKMALNRASELVKDTMEKKIPRSKLNKKHMSDNINTSELQTENGVDYVEIGPRRDDNSEFFYSKFTEYGTTKQPAQHWAEKSVLENKKKIQEIIAEELEKGLEEFDK
jgi:HK97 gp10 family phage protein